MTDQERTTLWTHRTRAGRTVECVTWVDQQGIEVAIIYDGSPLAQQTFVRSDDAEMWSTQQLELHRLRLQKRVHCPRCDAIAERMPRSASERVLKLFTRRRPYRCHRCRWRGWQVPA